MCYYDKNGNDNTKYPNPNIEKETNYISAEINIEKLIMGREIRIINSFEESERIPNSKNEEYENGNENEIKIIVQ